MSTVIPACERRLGHVKIRSSDPGRMGMEPRRNAPQRTRCDCAHLLRPTGPRNRAAMTLRRDDRQELTPRGGSVFVDR